MAVDVRASTEVDCLPGEVHPTTRVVSSLFVLAGAAISTVALSMTQADDISDLGLFDALPGLYFVGTSVLAAGFAWSIARRDSPMAWLHIFVLTIVMHGAPGLVEPHPRFPVAWLHVGFANQIAVSGELLVNVDARFSWPGFFAAAAMLQRIAGTESLLWILRFTPVIVNLVAAVLTWRLARVLGSSVHGANLAAALFVVLNWIGQDYFSPQATAFLIAIWTLILVLGHVPPGRVLLPALGRLLGEASDGDADDRAPRKAIKVYLVVVACSIVLTVTHQLTPPMLAATLLALSLLGRIRTKMLGIIVGILVLGWLSFGAEAYWLGHFEKLVGSVGDVAGVVGANVQDRTTTTGLGRRVVVRSRLFMAGAVWGASSLVLLVRRFRGTLDVSFVALIFGPFALVAAQPYGGELLLRVALFTLPACAVLLASAMTDGRRRLPPFLVGALIAMIVPVSIIARFGNESFERVLNDDLELTMFLYDTAPDRSLIYTVNRQTLVAIDRVGELRFRDLSTLEDPDDIAERLAAEAADGATVFVLLTRSQAVYGTQTEGRPTDWLAEFGEKLTEQPNVIVVRDLSRDTRLLEIRP